VPFLAGFWASISGWPTGNYFRCTMSYFGKSVAEPTSDAIQARRAMAHHGSSIVALSRFVQPWRRGCLR